MDTIDISKLDKAAVLAALYNRAAVQGLGFMQASRPEVPVEMTVEQAQSILDGCPAAGVGRLYFDYLHGRVMKVDLEYDEMETWLYDRDNGSGAAREALTTLLQN